MFGEFISHQLVFKDKSLCLNRWFRARRQFGQSYKRIGSNIHLNDKLIILDLRREYIAACVLYSTTRPFRREQNRIQQLSHRLEAVGFGSIDGVRIDCSTDATMRQVNELPPGATVRFLWEPRALYCDGVRLRCIPDSLMDGWYYARRTAGQGDPADIAAQWQGDGADYLLVYEFGREFEREHAALYDSADWLAWGEFAGEFLDEVWRTGNPGDDVQYILYRWRAP